MTDQRRPGLRSESRLQLPANDVTHGLGRGQRSPSPLARPGNGVFFATEQHTTTMASNDTVQALTTALQGMKVSSRKPELPDFDAKNVDIWLKRVSNAYRRAGITDSQDKFAFIETKFAVDSDPKINELIFSDGTAEKWTEFETYLRDRYGRTKAQQTAVVLDGVQRLASLLRSLPYFIR